MMDRNDERRDRPTAKELFNDALERPPQNRREYLDRVCGDDVQLRAKVEELLRVHDAGGPFLAAPTAHPNTPSPEDPTRVAGESMLEAASDPLLGTRIGPYKLLECIGEGGFGAVYMAEQREPVHRKVALKLIKPGMDSRQVIARFDAERQALAIMEHPHIARVFDGGVTDAAAGARPYFVMEYVKGDAITAFADAHRLNIRDRLDLFTQVCQAVQHAHTKGVIHRDLKPRNVLVSMVDGRPFAKVIDFGIAKATGSPLTDKTLFTEHRQLVGTLEYMSPEQAEGSPDIDTRTDVYALGVLLYELLTGATPFDAKRLRSAAFAEMQRIIKEEDPPLPSVRSSRSLETLVATAAARQVEPGQLETTIRGELDWIVMKALDKDRARRYESASQLRADVQRHVTGEPVVAAPPSAAYRLRKFVRRHRGTVIAAGLVVSALLLGGIGTTVGFFQARAAERRTSEQAQRASRIARFMQSTLFGAEGVEELAANREILKELIAGAAAGDRLDPKRWPNVRLALRLIEGHWRETPPSTQELSRVLTGLLDAALVRDDGRAARDAALSEHNARGVLFVLSGRIAEADGVFRTALALTNNQADGRERLVHAEQLTRLGLVIEVAGWTGMRPLFEEALAIRRQLLSAGSPDLAESMEDLARAWMGGGNEELIDSHKSLSLLDQSLAIRRGDPAVPPETIARLLSALGGIQQVTLENHTLGTRYLREALSEWKRAFPGDHERVADAFIELGRAVLQTDPYESEQLFRQGHDMAVRLESGSSERVANALRYLAEAQNRAGQFALAADTAERAIKMCEQLPPSARAGWYDAVQQMRDACRRMAATGAMDAAESCYRRLIALVAVAPASESARRLCTEYRDFLEWCGRPDEGRAIISDLSIVRVGSENLPYSTRLADDLEQMGRWRLANGKYTEAEEWFRRCLAMREENRIGPRPADEKEEIYGHRLLLRTEGQIGLALMKQGRYAEAEPLMLRPCESVFPDDRWEPARLNALNAITELYAFWNEESPGNERARKLASWRERLARLQLACGLEKHLNIENVRTLLVKTSAGETLNYDEWKRARTFVRFMTGYWTEDPLTAASFRELVATASKTIEMQPSALASNAFVKPDNTSVDYVVSHAALCVLDGRWGDGDSALSREIEARSTDFNSDSTLRLMGCHAALREGMGQAALAHSTYARIVRALEQRDSPDPIQLAIATFDAARTAPKQYEGESEKAAIELRKALELIASRVPATDPRTVRCLLEMAEAGEVGNALPLDQQEPAHEVFKEAMERAERHEDAQPLLLAEVLRRYGGWLAGRWHAFPPSRAVETLERAATLYRNAGLTNSPQLADALGNLGTAFWNGGSYKDAAGAFCESAELRLALGEVGLGETPGHDAGVIPAITACADCLAASDDLPNAERFYRAAVSIAERDAAGAYTARDARVRLRQFLMWSGRVDEAGSVLDAEPNWFGTGLPTTGYEDNLAGRCRDIAAHLLRSRESADAVRAVQIVRRGLRILEAGVPQAERALWWKHDFDSLLGDALVVQGKFDEAEPMLLASYEGLRSDPKTPETSGGQDRRREALERIVRMYETWHLAEPARGADSKAAEWRAHLENTATASAPASQP